MYGERPPPPFCLRVRSPSQVYKGACMLQLRFDQAPSERKASLIGG